VILRSACETCFQRFLISIEEDAVGLLSDLKGDDDLCMCPRLCGGMINVSRDSAIELVIDSLSSKQVKEPIHLTVKELYRAVHGGGLPDELPKSGYATNKLLEGQIIKKVVLDDRGDGEVYLQELVLGNGLIIHMSSGLFGAQILKIVEGER